MKLFAFRCSSSGLGAGVPRVWAHPKLSVRFLDNWHYVVMKSSLGKTMDRLKASVADSPCHFCPDPAKQTLWLRSSLLEELSTSQSIGQMRHDTLFQTVATHAARSLEAIFANIVKRIHRLEASHAPSCCAGAGPLGVS